MIFWSSALQIAAKKDRLRSAEAKLLKLAEQYGNRNANTYEITSFDTKIERTVVPIKYDNSQDEEGSHLIIHSVHIKSKKSASEDDSKPTTTTPLVLLHGYMNASAYFYRNLVGLSHYFQSIHSLDMLGWGLSSRPKFELKEDSVQNTEDFFVESLEAWRVSNNIDKMILAGHSMGGHMSIAYCEKYPQHVEKLVLLSPAGVNEQSQDEKERIEARRASSWKNRLLFGLATNIFQYSSYGGIFRSLPSSKAEQLVQTYVERRIPSITDVEERTSVAEYLFANAVLPPSGEYCLNKVLSPFAFGLNPSVHRIPKLKVKSITFLFGENDWMNPVGGLQTQKICEDMRLAGKAAPLVDVFEVSDAGHLLMLDNWEEFNAGVISAAGGKETLTQNTPFPKKLSLEQTNRERHSEFSQSTTRRDELETNNGTTTAQAAT